MYNGEIRIENIFDNFLHPEGFFCILGTLNDRGVEQLVARWAHNPKVAGSSPAPATMSTYKVLLVKKFRWIYED